MLFKAYMIIGLAMASVLIAKAVSVHTEEPTVQVEAVSDTNPDVEERPMYEFDVSFIADGRRYRVVSLFSSRAPFQASSEEAAYLALSRNGVFWTESSNGQFRLAMFHAVKHIWRRN